MKAKGLGVSILLVLVFLLAAAVVPGSPVLAATPIYVNGATGDDTWDGQAPAWDGTHGPKKTIQAGVGVVDIGGTVNVAAGTYDEQVVITKSLTLQGAGDTSVVLPSAPGKLTSLYALPKGVFAGRELAGIVSVRGLGAAGVTVKGFKLDGANVAPRPTKNQYTVGVLYAETAGTIDGVTVVNMATVSEGPRSYGIWLDGWNAATSIEVNDCYIDGFNRNGIMLSGDHLTAYVHDNTVKGLTRVSQVPNGIIVIDGAAATISRNTITDCHYTPAGTPQWLACGIGMYQYCAPGVLIEYNTISQCDVGIAPSNDAIVSHNLLTDNYIGLTLDQGAHNDIITCNDILGNIDGIVMGLDPGSVAHWNNIVGNTFGVRNLYTIMLDATNNWWGDASGPKDLAGTVEVPPCNADPTLDMNADGAGNEASDNVHYCPWLLAPIDGCHTEKSDTGEYVVDASGATDTEVVKKGDGDPTVSAIRYASNPGADLPCVTIGVYIDVAIDDAANVDEIEVRLYYTASQIAGLPEQSLRLYWWDGSSWVECSNTGVNAQNVDGYSGYVWARITADSTPNLSQLVGLPFGVCCVSAPPRPPTVPASSLWGTAGLAVVLAAILVWSVGRRLVARNGVR